MLAGVRIVIDNFVIYQVEYKYLTKKMCVHQFVMDILHDLNLCKSYISSFNDTRTLEFKIECDCVFFSSNEWVFAYVSYGSRATNHLSFFLLIVEYESTCKIQHDSWNVMPFPIQTSTSSLDLSEPNVQSVCSPYKLNMFWFAKWIQYIHLALVIWCSGIYTKAAEKNRFC